MADLISVIVTTYNRVDALDAVLRSLSRQTDRNFEVIVADDGSGPETAACIAGWQARLGVPLAHIWHEDRGFRAAEIRNLAILKSQGTYCVFLDGDCLAREDFVAAHRALAEHGWFVTGNRVLLSQELTAQVLRDAVAADAWPFSMWLMQRLRGGVNRMSALVGLPLGPLRKIRRRTWRGARSCNLAIWRADLAIVDGFDSDYVGWGKEDSDIIVRLIRAGIWRKDGNFATGVIHLWHAEASRNQLETNEDKLDAAIASGAVTAKSGLAQLAQQTNAAMRSQSQR